MLLTAALLGVGTGTKLAMAVVAGEAGRHDDSHGVSHGVSHGGDTSVRADALPVESEPGRPTSLEFGAKMPGMDPGSVWVLHGCLSVSMLVLLVIRLLHYGGKEPRFTDALSVWRTKMGWWVLLGVWWALPVCAAAWMIEAAGESGVRPLVSLGVCCGLTTSLMLIESALTHTL